MLEECVDGVDAFRTAHPGTRIDVQYADLVPDPVGTVRRSTRPSVEAVAAAAARGRPRGRPPRASSACTATTCRSSGSRRARERFAGYRERYDVPRGDGYRPIMTDRPHRSRPARLGRRGGADPRRPRAIRGPAPRAARRQPDRDAVRHAFADLHVAHAEAEESLVYPQLRQRAVGAHEAEHGEEEHAEGNEALLAVLELEARPPGLRRRGRAALEAGQPPPRRGGADHPQPGSRGGPPTVRHDLGEAFAAERNALLEDGCGTLTNVRRIVAAARKEGLLDEDDNED